MEEWIGERWHRWITRAADRSFPAQAVALAEVKAAAAMLFHAVGGGHGVRVVPAGESRAGGSRGWLQKIAGSGRRAATAKLDADTLALPPVIAVFDDKALNRDLYLWLAALAAAHEGPGDWIAGNRAATARVLQRCPGLRARWQRLRDAQLAQRPGPEQGAEAAVRAALRDESVPHAAIAAHEVAPVWVWLEALPASAGDATAASDDATRETSNAAAPRSDTRRRTRRVEPQKDKRAPLLLPSKTEQLMSWAEHVPLDRATDDEDDGNAQRAADDMEQLAITRDGQAGAARIKFDLDLPSASVDDVAIAEGETLPEWNWKRQKLEPDHCRVVTLMAQPGTPFAPGLALRRTARQVRRRLEVLRAAPRWQRRCADGEAIDLDAWVRHAADAGEDDAASATPRDPLVFARRTRGERSFATLLLADLSLSTDAHVDNDARVIDVIRDALYVFGEALEGTGDAFEMLGFSSVRRQHVRMQHLKGFDEAWSREAQARVGAIKPGYYTRMGAALRHATQRLALRPERQRLLLILTDGKPNDLDVYEGRWGLEDTCHAVHEAREAGLLPFCLSIDEEAHEYLPHLFGRGGWAQVRRPAELPARLASVYARLTR
ncbi:MAG: VWA domain-containing protein [Piscinibacter sp.]|uniref:nitric oxide reductase activation protein NorD n=1 Tax=Piscinibacter sp. TaxID=1903157 RepID=UPI001B6DB407|nr:VWA domain-containing protein [Piscinibacter sp.]MBP5991711.1 VWA domain-containing protein [Piscinibacter sp.]MBP6029077.1 VWA domain-containing protein [Piscinibacter sp.]